MFERLILNKYTFIAAITLILIGGGYAGYKHQLKKAGEAARQAQEEKQIAAYNADLAKSLNTSRKLAQELQQKVEDLENEKANIKRQRDFALGELRKRPTREQAKERASSDPTSAPKTCTGAELPREDAEFLIGEAARASAVVAERDYYYSAYKSVVDKLKELNGKD